MRALVFLDEATFGREPGMTPADHDHIVLLDADDQVLDLHLPKHLGGTSPSRKVLFVRAGCFSVGSRDRRSGVCPGRYSVWRLLVPQSTVGRRAPSAR